MEAEVRQGFHLIDAARRADITHFVYSSVASADQQTGIPHFDSKFRIEEHLRGTGMHYTIVRPVFFMENWLGMRQMIENGAIALPLDPDHPPSDGRGGRYRRCGRNGFRAFGQMAGPCLRGCRRRTIDGGIGAAFSRVTGREVQYRQVPWEEFEAQAGREMTTMFRWFQDTGYHVDIQAVRQEYPKLTTFVRWLNSNWHYRQPDGIRRRAVTAGGPSKLSVPSPT